MQLPLCESLLFWFSVFYCRSCEEPLLLEEGAPWDLKVSCLHTGQGPAELLMVRAAPELGQGF